MNNTEFKGKAARLMAPASAILALMPKTALADDGGPFSDVTLLEWMIVAVALAFATFTLVGLFRLRSKVKKEAEMYKNVFERVKEMEEAKYTRPAPPPEAELETDQGKPNAEGVIVISASDLEVPAAEDYADGETSKECAEIVDNVDNISGHTDETDSAVSHSSASEAPPQRRRRRTAAVRRQEH